MPGSQYHPRSPRPVAALWAQRDASERRAMLTEILAQVSSEALQGDTLEAVLQRIVDCLARHLPVTIASIILLNDAGTHFVQEVWSGDLLLDLPGDLPWPVTVGAAGRCAREGRAQLIEDVYADPDYVPGNTAVKSEYLVPIRHHQRLHGVLNLESTRADFFSHEVCKVFDAVAAQIAGAIHLARVVGELELANRKLEQLSMSDGLTGIANRRCFDARLAQEWRRHANDERWLSLLFVDVDCFKALNDARGHLYGDECLRGIAQLCLRIADGPEDLVARYGGEEIAVLLPGKNLSDARRIAERLRARIESESLPHPNSHIGRYVTISIGVSAVRPDADGAAEALLAQADRALYAAKALGRNRVVARRVR